MAAVTVVARGLDLVAGKLGADGTADDIGMNARFQMLSGAWYDGAGTLYVTDWYADGSGPAAQFDWPTGVV